MKRIALAIIALVVFVPTASANQYWHGTEDNDLFRPRNGADYHAANGHGGDDEIFGGRSKDILYGGEGNDLVVGYQSGRGNSDDLFGGDFSCESENYGFPGWPDGTYTCEDYPPGIDGADVLKGGGGKDWLWESNSDVHGDGAHDRLNGGPGFDVCVLEATDTQRNCEDVRIVS